MYVINEADACRQSHCYEEDGVLEPEKGAPDPCAQQKDYAASPKDYRRMARPLIGLVDDVEFVGNTEINQFSNY